MVISPLAVSKQLVEQVAEPSLEDGDLGFSNRHVFRPVIRHRPCHRSALRSSPARTRGRYRIVVEIVVLRVGRHAPLRFLRASHGAIVASLADPLNSRSARHITPSSRLVRSGIVDSGREGGLRNIDANDPKHTLGCSRGKPLTWLCRLAFKQVVWRRRERNWRTLARPGSAFDPSR